MEIEGAGARRGQARPTAQQKEEWERAGFDAVLAQALFARPFLAPAETSVPRGSTPEAGGEHAAAARARAEQAADATGVEDGPATAKPEEPAAPAAEPEAKEDRPDLSASTDAPPEAPDFNATEAPTSDLLIGASSNSATRGAAAATAGARAEADGASAIGAASRAGDRSAGDRETTPERARPEPPVTLRPSSEEAAKAARAFRPVEVSFDAGDGQEGRLRVSVQGQSVRATILAPDAPLARQLERSVPELQRSLREKGFRRTEVSVRPPRERAQPDLTDAESRVAANPER